jgi:hypothetical protein
MAPIRDLDGLMELCARLFPVVESDAPIAP